MTQLSFALSLVFVLPLADLLRRRSLLTGLPALAAAALAVAGLAPGPAVALAAFAALGRALRGADHVPARQARYGEFLRSTALLHRTSATIRVRSAHGALGFAAFSVSWSTAAPRLGGPPFHYAPAVIGLFGLLGAAGAPAADLTGRIGRPGGRLPTAAALAGLLWAVTSVRGRR